MSSAPTTTRGNGRLSLISNPIVQAGFAGLSVVLIAILCWRMHVADEQFQELMALQAKTTAAIEQHTAMIENVGRIVMDKL